MVDPQTSNGLTARSLVVGTLQVLIICLGAPYAIWVLGASEITWSFFPTGVGFPLVCLVLINALLKAVNRNWALRPAEMITVVVMGLVVIGIPIFIVGYVLSIPTTPYYFASSENQWGTYVLPHLPEWLVPSNAGLAMTWFFEGLPYGQPVPWAVLLDAWFMPMFWWLSFIWTLYLVCFALVVVLRKQWVEHEKLAFPLTEFPLLLRGESPAPRKLPAIAYKKLFWAGAAIPLFVILWNTVGYFFHFVPKIEWFYPVEIARGFPVLNVYFYLPVIGFIYFVNLNISFSVWFFYVLILLEEGLFNRFGIGVSDGDAFVWGYPSTSWQSWGAFVVMVVWGLWMARDHLKAVCRKAWNPHDPLDDSRELLSYRWAVVGLVLGNVYLLAWLCRAGMALPVALLFLAGVLIAYIGMTRLVIHAGLYYINAPVVSQAMTMMTLGTSAISAPGVVAIGLTYSVFCDVQSIFMVAAAHAAKLQDAMRIDRRGLVLAIALAVVIGFFTSIFYIIAMAYEQGASNFNSWFFRVSSGAGVQTFNDVMAKIKTPTDVHVQKLGYFGMGAVAMSILTFLQYRFPWWPLHPVGFAVASLWMIRRQAFSIFIGWAAKSLIMRFGGIELYRKAAPFFIGLIVGQFTGVGISFIIDMIFFPGNGHPVLHG